METLQAVVALVLGVVGMFSVSALVWATVIDLIQIVQGKVRESRTARACQTQETQQ